VPQWEGKAVVERLVRCSGVAHTILHLSVSKRAQSACDASDVIFIRETHKQTTELTILVKCDQSCQSCHKALQT
jgi:hypothetical protein